MSAFFAAGSGAGTATSGAIPLYSYPCFDLSCLGYKPLRAKSANDDADEGRVQEQRLPEGNQCLLGLFERKQRIAFVCPGGSMLWVQAQRLLKGGQRLLVSLESEQCGTFVYPGGSML